jgi:hypothetical protein
MEDVKYFQDKLYRALNIPISRLETDSGFNMGRSSEISRDEVKFTKFIQRLRKRFSVLFHDVFKNQCILKGIITIEDWDNVKESIIYDFNDDNHFFELKDSELLENRINQLTNVSEYIGTYFSVEWVKRNILKQTDADIEEIEKQIEAEKAEGDIDPEAGTNLGGPDGGFGDPVDYGDEEYEEEPDEEPEEDKET